MLHLSYKWSASLLYNKHTGLIYLLCMKSKGYEDKERKTARYFSLELYEVLGKLSIHLDVHFKAYELHKGTRTRLPHCLSMEKHEQFASYSTADHLWGKNTIPTYPVRYWLCIWTLNSYAPSGRTVKTSTTCQCTSFVFLPLSPPNKDCISWLLAWARMWFSTFLCKITRC